jgi:thioesterase domain-containing protein
VESIAKDYVAEIEKLVAPGEKVVVAGYSFGGTVAFEVASQLRGRGIVDPLPIIIDMTALNASGTKKPTSSGQTLDVLRNLPAWIAQEAAHFHPSEFLLRCFGNVRRMVRAFGGKPVDGRLDPLIYFGRNDMPETLQNVLNAMYHAMCTYVPAYYDGKVVLLRAMVPSLFRSRNVTMGWESVAAGVEVHLIAGRHDDCTSEAHSSDLGAVLDHCAAAFEAGESAS